MQSIKSFYHKSGTPVTFFVLASLIAAFLLSWLGLSKFFLSLALVGGNGFMPWTIVSYPWAFSGDGSGLLFLICGWMFLWNIGRSVEMDLGAQKYSVFLGGMILLSGLSVLIGSFALNQTALLIGAFVPVAAIAVAWATRNPEQQVMLLFFPVPGKAIGWLSAALVLFSFGTGSPLLGLFAVLPCIFAYFFASNKIPGLSYSAGRSGNKRADAKKDSKRFNAYMDNVKKKEQEREERERLRKLFERSLIEDPEDGKRDTL